MDFKNLVRLLLFATVLATACKKNGSPTPKKGVDVYVAGFTTINNNPVATYWKNGTATKLVNANTQSSLSGLAVQNNNLYLVGSYVASNGKAVAAFWKNNILTKLTDSTTSCGCSSIFLSGSDIYISGYITDPISGVQVAVYWKNGIIIKLSDNSTDSFTSAICAQGGNVFVAGTKGTSTGGHFAIYWENGTPTYLPPANSETSQAFAIALNNTDVYVAGGAYGPFVYGVTAIFVASYWKDGVVTKLGDGAAYSDASGIAFSGNDIYISGNTRAGTGLSLATYWKNGVIHTLADGSSYSDASSIAVDGNDVYVSGDSMGGYATYWKNGTAVVLDNSFSGCGSIVLVEK